MYTVILIGRRCAIENWITKWEIRHASQSRISRTSPPSSFAYLSCFFTRHDTHTYRVRIFVFVTLRFVPSTTRASWLTSGQLRASSFLHCFNYSLLWWLFSTCAKTETIFRIRTKYSTPFDFFSYSIVSLYKHGFRGVVVVVVVVTRSTFARLGARPFERPIGDGPRGTHGRTKSFDWQGHV